MMRHLCFLTVLVFLTFSRKDLTSAVVPLVDCGSPETGSNAVIRFENPSLATTEGQVAVYTCESGYKYDWGVTELLCNVSGTWELVSGPNATSSVNRFDCDDISTYQGCLQINGRDLVTFPVMIETALFESANRKECQRFCREMGQPFVARQGSFCICLPNLLGDLDPNNSCEDWCADNQSYCGNRNMSLYSVYTSVGECVTLQNDTADTLTSMYTMETCQEYCRGMDRPVSFWRGALQHCSCLQVLPALQEESRSTCTAIENDEDATPTTTGRIYITEILPVLQVSSCEEIFNSGIFVHGDYYLGNGTKVSCNFYDGSAVCDRGWLSYSGHCYSFLSELLTARSQFNACADRGSLLVSVSDQGEWSFLNKALTYMGYMRNTIVYIGLYDTQKTFSYMWSDETPVTFRKFYTGYPNTVDNRCIYLSQWNMYNVACNTVLGAICERSPAVMGCVAVSPFAFGPTLTSAVMTTPLCFETCRSTGVRFSLTKGEKCYCLNDTSSFTNTSVGWSACNHRCPGNTFQMCGANDTSHVFVIEGDIQSPIFLETTSCYRMGLVNICNTLADHKSGLLRDGDVGQPYRTDCRDMVLGSVFTNLTLFNATTNQTQVVDCRTVVGETCPDSWLQILDQCYRFFPEAAASPTVMCNSIGGYAAVYETQQEAAAVQRAILETPTLAAVDQWLFGLFHQRASGSRLRYTNGAFVNGTLRARLEAVNSVCLAHKSRDVWNISAVSCGSAAYVCETGDDYLGCYQNPTSNLREIVFYKDLTVLQCKQTCKAVGTPYAAIRGSASCYCVEEGDLTKEKSEATCVKTCATGQMCGGEASVTVYALDYTEPVAESCTELFDQGVLLTGQYLLANGLTYCGMKDSNYLKSQAQLCAEGDVACDLDISDLGWHRVGTGDLDLALDTKYWTDADTLQTRCDGVYNPATILSPAYSQEAVGLITEVLEWTLDYPDSRGAYVGLVDEFIMGIYSYSDGSIFRMDEVWPNVSANGQLAAILGNPNNHAHAQITEEGKLQLIAAGSELQHVVCQRDTAYQGCFTAENPAALDPIVSGYKSMSLTLCRQACLGQGQTTLLVSSTDCVCSNITHQMAAVANNTKCSQPCPGSKLQHCGGSDIYRLYTFESDIALSCQELIDNFVLLPGTYNINGTMRICRGLDDLSTSCPAGYIATSGQCYRPNPRQDLTEASTHAQTCASQGGYLASPTSPGDLEALAVILKAFTSFGGLNLWMLGYWDIFNTGSYVTATGHMVNRTNNLTSHLTPDEAKRCVALNVTSGKTQTISCTTALPFVCQASPMQQDCASLNTSQATVMLTLSHAMTVQQCVALCKGESSLNLYALLRNGACYCQQSEAAIGYHTGSDVICDQQCPGNPLQRCGSSTSSDAFSVYSIDAYKATDIQYSCDELLTYGVIQPAPYLIDKDDYFSCNKYSEQSIAVLAQQTASQPQSDAQIKLRHLKLNGLTFGAGAVVDFVLDSLYVIEGIVSTGNFSSISFSTSIDGNTYEQHPENQNISLVRHSDDDLVSWAALPVPVVAQWLRISLNSLSASSQAGSFEFLGYDFKLHNFSNFFLGCFESPVVEQDSPPLTEPDLDLPACLDYCNNTDYRYVTLRDTGFVAACACVKLVEPRDPYARLTKQRKCNATCLDNLRCSSLDAPEVSVYAKYDFTCPIESRAHLIMSTTVPEGVEVGGSTQSYPIGTVLSLTCALGYEFKHTNDASIRAICSNLGGWGLTEDDFTCKAVDCGPFPDISGAIIRSTEDNSTLYNSTVKYACVSPEEAFGGIEAVWTMTCNHTKQWLPQNPECGKKLCQGDPPNVTLATSNASAVTNPTLGTIITFICEDGSRFPSTNATDASTECLLPGNWSAVEESCEKFRCPQVPPARTNAVLVRGPVEGQASYHCDTGFTYSDKQTVKAAWCNSSTFQWDVPVDQCKVYKTFQAQVCLAHAASRSSDKSFGILSARGLLNCAQLCLYYSACVSYCFNENAPFGEGNCYGYDIPVSNMTLYRDSDWSVYSMSGDC